jgi:hypothetical protein
LVPARRFFFSTGAVGMSLGAQPHGGRFIPRWTSLGWKRSRLSLTLPAAHTNRVSVVEFRCSAGGQNLRILPRGYGEPRLHDRRAAAQSVGTNFTASATTLPAGQLARMTAVWRSGAGLFQDPERRPSASRFPRGPRSSWPGGQPSRLRRRCGRCPLPTADSWPTVPAAPILEQPWVGCEAEGAQSAPGSRVLLEVDHQLGLAVSVDHGRGSLRGVIVVGVAADPDQDRVVARLGRFQGERGRAVPVAFRCPQVAGPVVGVGGARMPLRASSCRSWRSS